MLNLTSQNPCQNYQIKLEVVRTCFLEGVKQLRLQAIDVLKLEQPDWHIADDKLKCFSFKENVRRVFCSQGEIKEIPDQSKIIGKLGNMNIGFPGKIGLWENEGKNRNYLFITNYEAKISKNQKQDCTTYKLIQF